MLLELLLPWWLLLPSPAKRLQVCFLKKGKHGVLDGVTLGPGEDGSTFKMKSLTPRSSRSSQRLVARPLCLYLVTGRTYSGKYKLPKLKDISSSLLSRWSNGEGDGTHSSTLAWKIPWTEEPGRLWSMGSQRIGHNWVTNSFTFLEYRDTARMNDVKGMESKSPWWDCQVRTGV